MRNLPTAALPLLLLALAAAGCASGSGTGPERPGRASASDVEALEEAIARLEQRQLAQIQRQHELEAKLEALARGADRRAAQPARPERPPRPRRPGRPDPSEVYAVPIADSPARGPDDALVTMVHAFEFACPFCHRVRPTLEQLREEYGGDLRIVYKDFIVHPQRATTPALAACAAHAQGRHAAMEARIWERGYEQNDLSEANMKKIARGIGLDMDQFEADMSGDACRDRLTRDRQLMMEVGTRGTPNFYINGRPLSGARPISQFRAVIDQELEKARERVADGTAPSDYYREWVLEKGKSSL